MDRRTLLGLAVAAAASTTTPDKAAASSGGGSGASSPESYLRLPVVTASVFQANGRRGVLSVETGLDTPDPVLRARVARSVPRLRAAYNTAVQSFANGLRPGMAPDIDRLSALLQTATNATLGRAGARLLLGTVMAA